MKKYRRCKNCNRKFEYKDSGRGRPRVYCSDSCKTLKYLKRCNKLEKEIELQKLKDSSFRFKVALVFISIGILIVVLIGILG